MKKTLAATLAMLLAVGLMTGCSNEQNNKDYSGNQSTTEQNTEAQTTQTTQAETEETPPANPDFGGDLTSFTAKDFNGNEVTEAIFADYDVTMVNVWATWCGYCVEEMPGIAELYKNLDSNLNIVTICQDAEAAPKTAASLIEQTGIQDMTVIVGNDEIEEKVIDYLVGFPTTVFVNSKGQVVGEVMIGVPVLSENPQVTADAYRELFDIALAAVK